MMVWICEVIRSLPVINEDIHHMIVINQYLCKKLRTMNQALVMG